MILRLDESQVSWRHAIEQWQELTRQEPDHVTYAAQLAHAHSKLGDAILGQGIVHWREAKAEYETALAIGREAVAMSNSTDFERRVLATILTSLGHVAMVSGQNQEAANHIHEAIDLFEEVLQHQPSVLSCAHDLATAYFRLGNCESMAGRMSDSETAYRKGTELEEHLVAQAPGNAVWESLLAELDSSLGNNAREHGDSETALKYYDRSKQLLDAILIREPNFKNAQDSIPSVLSIHEIGRAHV